MLTKQTRNAGLLAAVAAVSVPALARATAFYYGGYNDSVPVAGTPDLPVSGPFVVPGQVTFYSDAAGTQPNAAGTGFVTTGNTSAELVLGGSSAATAYTAETPASSSAIAIRSIILLANNPGSDTLKLGFTSGGRYSIATGGTGTVNTVGTGTPTIIGAGIYQGGSSNWDFVNGGSANSPIRLQSNASISGPGSGNLSIPFNIASTAAASLGVNLTGGATLTLGGQNDFGTGNNTTSFSTFTLTAGTVNFTSIRPFGGASNQVNLNGGTLTSTTGTTITTNYAGIGAAGGTPGYVLGGTVTLAGTTSYSLGTSQFNLSANRTIVANNTGATGATIGGVVTDGGNAYGLTVGAGSTGTLTLTGANTYTGATIVQAGKLVLGTSAQTPVLSGSGGADVQGGQLVLNYTGASNVDTVRGLLATAYTANGGVLTTGQLRSGLATAARGIGYSDDGVGATTIKSALFGDADLDGGVSINDFNALAGAFGQSGGKHWTDGDFDYDGGVSINDFNLLAGNFGQSLPASTENWAGLLAFAAAHNDLAAFEAVTGVPEPTTLALVAGGLTLGVRRRRVAA